MFPVTAALHASVSIADWLKECHNPCDSSQQDDAIAMAVQARLTLALDRLRGNLTSAETLRLRIGGIMHLVSNPDSSLLKPILGN